MYTQSCRFALFTIRKQFTCTVRTAVVFSPVRSYHVTSSPLIKNHSKDWKYRSKLWSVKGFNQTGFSPVLSRHIASNTTPLAASAAESINSLDIPAPPPIPEVSQSVSEAVVSHSLAEPTFAEIGLGGWSPSGMVQSCFEWLHISCDLPWWGCIAIGVLTIRTLIFPLVIKSQRNSAKMANHMPQLTILQEKMAQARRSGNSMEAAQMAYEMQAFMKEKEINPFKNLMVPLVQAPIFMSVFFALKGMANAPVQSMTNGGLFWFTDLTMCDPFYLLPVLTSVTLWATIELGSDSARLNAQGSKMVIYVMRAMPILMFPITINFSGAILCYWLTTNMISLVQVGILRFPAVRDFFQIERPSTPIIPFKSESTKKGFIENVKEAWTNQKIIAELQDRQRVIDDTFRRAGTGPVPKTYSYDPTRQKTVTAQGVVQRGFKQIKKET